MTFGGEAYLPFTISGTLPESHQINILCLGTL